MEEEASGRTNAVQNEHTKQYEQMLVLPDEAETGEIVRLPLALADVFYGRSVVPDPVAHFAALVDQITWKKKQFENRATALYGDSDVQYAYGPSYGDYTQADRKPMAWTSELLSIKSLVEEAVNRIDETHYNGEIGRLLGAPIRFNVCLANYYRNGKEGIGFHADKEETGSVTPIASVSLGSQRRFLFTLQPHEAEREAHEGSEAGARTRYGIQLENGSLLVMWKHCQKKYLHSVPKDRSIKEGRLNLTFRYVPSSASL